MSSFFHEKKRGKDERGSTLLHVPEELPLKVIVVIIYIAIIIFILDYFWPIVVGMLATYLSIKYISKKNIKIAVICFIGLATVFGSMGWLNKVQNDKKTAGEQNALADAQRAVDEQKYNEENAKQDAANQAIKAQADAQTKEQLASELTSVCVNNHKSIFRPKVDELLTGDVSGQSKSKGAYSASDCKKIITGLYDLGYKKDDIKSVAESKYWVGMDVKLLFFSVGLANDYSTTTTTIFGKSSQLVYGDPLYGATYIYVDNGKVTSYQN